MTVPWIARCLERLHHWTKLQHILSLAKEPQESAKLGGCQCNHQNIPDSPDISLNDVSLPMTVHMETVYADDKNVTGFDVSWTPPRCHG
jgi:hypothetical protein